MTNEIINEGIEVTEEMEATTKSGSGLLIAAGVAAVAAVGYGVYRGVKAIVNAVKAKRAEKVILTEEVELDDASESSDD